MKIINSNEFLTNVYFVTESNSVDILDNYLKEFAKTIGFEGKSEQSFVDIGPNSSNSIVIGMGSEEKLTTGSFINFGYQAGSILDYYRIKNATINIPFNYKFKQETIIQCIAEGILHSTYKFDKYKNNKKKKHVEIIGIECSEYNQNSIDEIIDVTKGNHIARDLVNIPAIDLFPDSFAEIIKNILRGIDVKVTVYDKKEIEQIGMDAFLAVAKGSEKEPKLIVMEYLPNGNKESAVALVGKGITYDSGGYALKDAVGMESMKSDMGGAATVVGAMYAIAKQKLKKNVIGIIPACENMVSGGAYKNGDIIGSMKGTTIEVGNTDAEGRIILADSIYYAAKSINSECIIDIATLTGACVTALGRKITGAFTNNRNLLSKFTDISTYTDEAIWQLPLNEDFRNMIKGEIGDLKNSTEQAAGASTAAAFLEFFTEGKPWLHFDIGGTGWAKEDYGYISKGGTGVLVKSIYYFIKHY